jgi:Ca2+-binding RTX toxin-like protein
MKGTLESEHGRGRTAIVVAVSVLAVSLAAVAGPAAAKTISGSKKGETLTGTKRADKIKGRGGKDKLKGKGGNDKLVGGKGRDKLIGGSGADRHLGGKGNDVLRAADGRLDRAINGGSGNNTCIIDIALELSIVRGCGTIQAGGAGSYPGAPGGGGGAGGGGPGAGGGLRVLTAQGLVCLPLVGCVFLISGDGADALLGGVAGGGSVTSVLNVAVNTILGSDVGTWVATGAYTCGAQGGPGFLIVTIGSESSPPIPIECG